DAPGSLRRRAYRGTINDIFHMLIRYIAPVLPFTAEEVWQQFAPDAPSVHLLEAIEWPEVTVDEARWKALRDLREQVTEAVEPLRRDKVVRSSLEAEVTVPASAVPEGFTDADLAELFITATVRRGDGGGVTVTRTSDHKCGRCWRLLPEVVEDGDLCARCEDVVGEDVASEGVAS
ncbi:MAG: class I tRNA ligase family protein, partial [Tsuneonella sp.]